MATDTTKIALALTLVLATGVIGFSQAHAELTIWQVENNPPGADSGAEWFTLINTGSNDTFDGYSIMTTNGRIGFYNIPAITLGTCEYHKVILPKQTIDNRDDTVRLIKDDVTVYETPVIKDTKNNDRYWTNPDVAATCGEPQADAATKSQESTHEALVQRIEALEAKIAQLESLIEIIMNIISTMRVDN